MDSTDGDAILGGRLDGLTDEPGDEAENGWDMDVEYAGCQSDIWTVFVPRRSEQKQAAAVRTRVPSLSECVGGGSE